jgi:hypothetical protein
MNGPRAWDRNRPAEVRAEKQPDWPRELASLPPVPTPGISEPPGFVDVATQANPTHLPGMVLPSSKPPPDTAEVVAFRQAIAAGVASLDAGRSTPYEDVRRWLLSWGTENELPPPECP